jgi:hypothetical protein
VHGGEEDLTSAVAVNVPWTNPNTAPRPIRFRRSRLTAVVDESEHHPEAEVGDVADEFGVEAIPEGQTLADDAPESPLLDAERFATNAAASVSSTPASCPTAVLDGML